MKLKKKSVAKPWGRTELPESLGGARKRKIGEIWFEAPEGVTLGLMTKYLFTSEKLSIQVHPNDRFARRLGHVHGKEECWYILDAEPGAVLGLGLTKEVSPSKLRAAIACDQIEQLVDWKPVAAGDFFYVPAGTIHAIGPGLTLVEIQQNLDLTYRLYDYGRPRELHIEDAVTVANPGPYDMINHEQIRADQSTILVDGPHFRVFQIVGDDKSVIADVTASEWHVTPIDGSATARGKKIAAGECGIAGKATDIDFENNVRSLVACNMK